MFDRQLTPEKVAGECAYLAAPTARGFKRPYGWAWALKLADELGQLPDPRWARALTPMMEIFAQRFREFLPLSPYPVRVGTHFNTAFGLRMAADYAEGTGDAGLTALLRETALRWYGADADCPAWGEPSGDDFLSSALIEAEALRRLMPADDFRPWFDRFLPHLAERRPETLFRPATVTDRSDGKIAHLDGLNLSRAWCLRALSGALPADDARVPVLRRRRKPISTQRSRISPTTTWASTGWRASRFSRWKRETYTASTGKVRLGATNSSCAATVRISRDPASAVRRRRPKIEAAAAPSASPAERLRA